MRPVTFDAKAAEEAMVAAAVPKVKVSRQNAALLKEPAENAEEITPLPKGAMLEVVEKRPVGKRTFYHVKILDQEGWVSDKDVDEP